MSSPVICAAVEECLSGFAVYTVHNPNFSTRIAISIVSGFNAPGAQEAGGVLILLADMPAISSAHLDLLIGAFSNAGGRVIVRASFGDRADYPTILPRIFYPRLLELEGDRGALWLIETCGLDVAHIETCPQPSSTSIRKPICAPPGEPCLILSTRRRQGFAAARGCGSRREGGSGIFAYELNYVGRSTGATGEVAMLEEFSTRSKRDMGTE